MADFIQSLNQGIQAAQEAARNKSEIAAVFLELNQQLAQATDNKVAIKTCTFSKPIDEQGTLSAYNILAKREKYTALAAFFIPDEEKYAEIAKWKMPSSGYPCQITIGSDEFNCEDRVALENTLRLLLTQPTVGAFFYKYMNTPIPNKAL